MKKLSFIFCFLLLVTTVNAQSTLDKIIKHNGEVIYGLVVDIDKTKIKYRKDSELDATIYYVDKKDVAVITYRNGKSETFEDVPYETDEAPKSTGNIFSLNMMMLHRTDPNAPSYMTNPKQFGFFFNWSRLNSDYPFYPTTEFFYYSAKTQNNDIGNQGSFENRFYGIGIGLGINLLPDYANLRPYVKAVGGWMYGSGSIQTNHYSQLSDNGNIDVSEAYGNVALGVDYRYFNSWGLNLEIGYSKINKISLGVVF